MNTTIKYKIRFSLLAVVCLIGCNDKWDEHYKQDISGSELTVYEMIAQNSELSVFKTMIDKAGYADLLKSTQTFTVWAPINSALKSFDLEDEALVNRTVLNHIARFNQSTSNDSSTRVRMYNGKKCHFENGTYSGIAIQTSDILCMNGVLHTMKEAIPYSYNIREFIDNNSETSRLAIFLAQFDETLFDVENSIPVGVNELGETIYDSINIQHNRLLDHLQYGIGAVANEDSIFSMIVPDNLTWDKAFEEIRPWFKTSNDSITDTQTSLAIFTNLIFRQNLVAPSGLGVLISTTGCEYTSVDAMFYGSNRVEASNGSVWLASTLGQNPLESWNQPLEIESESSFTRKMDVATKSFSVTYNIAADNEFAEQISELEYIYVSSSSLDNPAVEFTINNPLSGTYRIYAYFVPAIVDNPTATTDMTRMKFSVTYPRAVTGTRTQTKNFTDASFITSPTEVSKMLVGEVTFPVSKFVDRLRQMDESYDATQNKSNFTIKVQTNVTQDEFNAGTYKRAFRLDRIVLEPVI